MAVDVTVTIDLYCEVCGDRLTAKQRWGAGTKDIGIIPCRHCLDVAQDAGIAEARGKLNEE